MDYLLFKALHIFFVLLWVAGVLINGVVLWLVARAPDNLSKSALQFLHFWDRWVSNIAQGGVWIIGITLIVLGGWFPDGWLIAKLVLVTAIAGIHGTQSATLRKLARGKDVSRRLAFVRHSAFIVVGIILLVVLLVVLKPI